MSKTSKSGTPNAAPPLPEAAAQTAGASPSSPPASNDFASNTSNIESSGTALDSLALDKIWELMSKSLQIIDLKAWIDSHNASTIAKTKKGMSSTSHKFAY